MNTFCIKYYLRNTTTKLSKNDIFTCIFLKKRNGYGTERKRRQMLDEKKFFREVVAKKYVSKTLIKKIAHPIHLQKCRRTECIELSGRLSRNM